MPKNRYSVKITGSSSIYASDNVSETKVEDNLRKAAALSCTLNGITTSDWGSVKEGATIELYYYDSAGTISSTPSFYGIIKRVKYMTQNSVSIEAGDMSVKLQRVPLATKDKSARFKYTSTNQSILNIIADLNSDNLDGANTIVPIGTIETSSEIVPKFEAYFMDRWATMQALAEKTGRIAWFDTAGQLNMTKRRGADYRETGTGTAGTNSLTDGAKSWTTNMWTGYMVRDSALHDYQIISNTATVLTLSGTPSSGTYFIIRGYFITGAHNAAYSDSERNGEEIWNDICVQGAGGVSSRYRDISTKVAYLTAGDTRLAAPFNSGNCDAGTGTGAAGSFIDSSKNWATDQWVNYVLEDSALNYFAITGNSATGLTVSGTPASGTYAILQTEITLETTSGIPNSPGVIYLEGGSPTFNRAFSAAAFGKVAAYYYYSGVSGNKLTGVGVVAGGTIKPRYEFAFSIGGATFPRGVKAYLVDRIRVDTTSGFTSTNAVILIGQEEIDYAMTDATNFYHADCGSGSIASTTVTDGSKAWATNCWVGYTFVIGFGSPTALSNQYKITANSGTTLTLDRAPTAGSYTYMILPAKDKTAVYPYHIARRNRNPYFEAVLTKMFFSNENTINVDSTASFDPTGYVQIMSNNDPIEICWYSSKDSTHFYLPTDGSGRAQLGTTLSSASQGCVLRQYGESVIHPPGVRVQQFPTNGTPENDSSIGTYGLRTRIITINSAISIEDAERFASRILMNKRFGDLYISLISYNPQDYNRLICGDLIEVTDSSLNLANYANNITKKEVYMNSNTGEFYSKFYIANPPPSDFDKLMRSIRGELGQNPHDEVSYVTGDDPKKLLRELCGAPGVKLASAGMDVSNENNTGYLNMNRLYAQPFSKNGPTFQAEPVYLYGVTVNTEGTLGLNNLTADPTGVPGGLYYNSFSGTFRGYAGGAWSDLGGGSSTGYWTTTTGGLRPTISGANVVPYTSGKLGDGVSNWSNGWIDDINSIRLWLLYSGTYHELCEATSASIASFSMSLAPASTSYSLGTSANPWQTAYLHDTYFYGEVQTNLNPNGNSFNLGNGISISSNQWNNIYGVMGWFGQTDCVLLQRISSGNVYVSAYSTSTSVVNLHLAAQNTLGRIQAHSDLIPYGTQYLGLDTSPWNVLYSKAVVVTTNSSLNTDLHVEIAGAGSIDIFASGTNANTSIDIRPKGSGNLQLWPSTGIIEAGASIIPDNTSHTYNLGSSTKPFQRLYLYDSTGLNADTVDGRHVDNTATGIIAADTVNTSLSNSFHIEPLSSTNTAMIGSNLYPFNEGNFSTLRASVALKIPTSAIASPVAGQMYFNPSTNYLYIYNGTSWKSVLLS